MTHSEFCGVWADARMILEFIGVDSIGGGDYCKLDEAAKPDDPVPAPTPDFDEED